MERQQLLAFIRIIAQFPHLMLSRELMRMVADLFEFVDDALLDELHAVGKQIMAAQQQQRPGAPGGNGVTASTGRTPAEVMTLRASMVGGGI